MYQECDDFEPCYQDCEGCQRRDKNVKEASEWVVDIFEKLEAKEISKTDLTYALENLCFYLNLKKPNNKITTV